MSVPLNVPEARMGSVILDPQSIALAVIALLAAYVLSRKKRRTPPGPPGLPLIGNLLDVPKRESWKEYLKWGKKYNSDILSMRVPGTQFFIMNSPKVVYDLLVKRSNIYSDRPHSTMINDLINVGWLIVFMNNDDRWKVHRHFFRREFDGIDATPVNRMHALQASRRLLHRLLKSADYEGELRLAAVDSVLSLTYGITPTNFEHPFIKVTGEVNAVFADVARGLYLVDSLPFLQYLPKWFPGLKFHKIAEKAKAYARDVVIGPYEEIQAQVDNGTAVPSVASRFLSSLQDGEKMSNSDIDAMRNTLANAYLAGSDTSVAVLYNFVLAIALHPEVQKKAQKELDEVLGGKGHRLPDFTDFPRLPYLTAVIYEIFRWHPVTPFAVYHVANQDDVYNGYDIPKGSIMVPNAYALLRDEGIFGANTEDFNPERFMKPDGTVKDFSDVDVAFGFGRRACPGRFIARDTIWIMAASLLSAYEISGATDANGNKLTPESPLEFTNAMISFAPKFNVTFRRRVPESVIHESITQDKLANSVG